MIEFDTQIIPTARAMSFLFSGRVQLSKCAKNFTLPPHLLGNHLLVGVSQKRDCPIGCGLLRRAIFYAHLAQSVPENQSKTQRILLMHADRFSQTRSSSNDAMSQRYEEEGHCAADRCIAATRQLSAVA